MRNFKVPAAALLFTLALGAPAMAVNAIDVHVTVLSHGGRVSGAYVEVNPTHGHTIRGTTDRQGYVRIQVSDNTRNCWTAYSSHSRKNHSGTECFEGTHQPHSLTLNLY